MNKFNKYIFIAQTIMVLISTIVSIFLTSQMYTIIKPKYTIHFRYLINDKQVGNWFDVYCNPLVHKNTKDLIAGDYLRCEFTFQNKYNDTIRNLKLYQSTHYLKRDPTKDPIDILRISNDGSHSREYSLESREEAILSYDIQVPKDTCLWTYWFNIYDEGKYIYLQSEIGALKVITYSDYLANKNIIIMTITSIASILVIVILSIVSIRIQTNLSNKQIELMKKQLKIHKNKNNHK